MSSVYRVLCLSHDPAIELTEEWRSGANGRDEIITAVLDRSGTELRSHPHCDLMVGKYSYPLVEVCCPVPATAPPTNLRNCCHAYPQWIDVKWLRLLFHAYAEHGSPVADAAAEMCRGCWSRERVRRLRTLLFLDEPS